VGEWREADLRERSIGGKREERKRRSKPDRRHELGRYLRRKLDSRRVSLIPSTASRVTRPPGPCLSFSLPTLMLVAFSIMMSGTSPFTFGNSPSYHSSSYLPKLEANFMRDFSCCGMILPSLHDLLQHYEEAHAQKSSQPIKQNAGDQPQMQDARAAVATNAAAAVQQQAQQHQGNFKPIAPAQTFARPTQPQQNQPKASAFSSNLQTIPDMDTVEDMEMDDMDGVEEKTPPPNLYTLPQSAKQSPQAQYSQPHQPRLPQLNMNLMQSHQGLRNSTPTTPVTQGRQFQNNPTVSSVNTPTLMSNPMQQQFQDPPGQYRSTPDSSAPGTPAELDEGIMSGMGDMSMQNNPLLMGNQNQNFGLGGFGMNNDMLDLCIDEPAKRLFSPTGGYGNQNQQYANMRLGSGQYGPNSDIARRIREQQMLAGVPDTTAGMMPNDEPKPFRCPVIGCEKAYKNQNGLKYHKSVSADQGPRTCSLSNISTARS
jgi:transcription factor SFP1